MAGGDGDGRFGASDRRASQPRAAPHRRWEDRRRCRAIGEVSAGDNMPRSIREMAEPPCMTISGTGLDPSDAYGVGVQKLAQDQAKQEGKQAVALIEQAMPQVGPNGEGSHVNTVA